MRNPTCTDCPLYEHATTVCIDGDGPRDADVILVGEAPGKEEDESGTPFVGRAGQLLDTLLQQAGLERSDLFVTNTVRCRPPGNRTPTAREIKACSKYLKDELAQLHPKLIVGLGVTAVKAISTAKSIKEARGKPLTANVITESLGAKIIGSYHPAAYLHSGSKAMLNAIVEDLRLATTSLYEEARTFTEREDHFILPFDTSEHALAILERLWDARALTVDCEWTAPKDGMAWPWTPGAELYSVSLSGNLNGVIVNVAIAWPQTPYFQSVLRKILESVSVVCHNAMADTMWLTGALGIKPKLYADSYVLSYLMDETTRHSLEGLATRLCGVPAWKRPLWDTTPATEEWPDLLKYNADDTYNTVLVYNAIMRQLKELPETRQQAIMRLHNKLILPAIPLYVEMALNGVGIDTYKLAEAMIEQERLRNDAGQRLVALSGKDLDEALAIPASHVKSKALLAEHGLIVQSTAKPMLEPLSPEYPVIQALFDVRRKNKLLGTYIRPWLGLLERQGTNRLHSIYKPIGTRTGRLSAEMEGRGNGGSIHQMPRNDNTFKVREMVIPADGNVIIGGDASQIELRVIAWIASDRTMIRLLNDGMDLHRATAASVAGIPASRVTKEQRQAAKATNFGLSYGQQIDGFITYAWLNYKIKLTRAEAEKARSGFFRLYRDLPYWHARCRNVAVGEQTITTPFGRTYHDVTTMQDAANWPVQGTASDIIQLSLEYFDELLRQEGVRKYTKLILSVHDSIAAEAPEKHALTVAECLKEALAHPPTERLGVALSSIPIPFKGDVGIGTTWGSLA